MIIDTSALVAVAWREDGYVTLLDAMLGEQGLIPTPVLVEFHRVTALAGNEIGSLATNLINEIIDGGISLLDFDAAAAQASIDANRVFGSGGGRGGKLNMLGLMVYGVAKVTQRPILCTGKDFAATDAKLHRASRGW